MDSLISQHPRGSTAPTRREIDEEEAELLALALAFLLPPPPSTSLTNKTKQKSLLTTHLRELPRHRPPRVRDAGGQARLGNREPLTHSPSPIPASPPPPSTPVSSFFSVPAALVVPCLSCLSCFLH